MIYTKYIPIFYFLLSISMYGQTTWTGSINSAWNNSGNWTDGVPDATDDVVIPSMANQPVLNSSGNEAKSITIYVGAILTITGESSIQINNSSSYAILNQGVVLNSGHIQIGNISNIGTKGVINEGEFSNNPTGYMEIDKCIIFGIENSGNFSNNGQLHIGFNFSIGSIGFNNIGLFTNTLNGVVVINRATTNQFLNNFGTADNYGSITLGSLLYLSNYCFRNDGNFTNYNSAQLNIDNSTSAGLYNPAGTFTNYSTINIGSIASVGGYGIQSNSTFNHEAGEININRTNNTGLYNDTYITFTNKAQINIGLIAGGFQNGIRNNGNFNNTITGNIQIEKALNTGILENVGTITNEGIINIGSLNSNGPEGIHVNGYGIFKNNPTGLIKINKTNSSGIENTGYYENYGNLEIGLEDNSGTDGINNTGLFTNFSTGTIIVDRASSNLLYNKLLTFHNYGAISLGNTSVSNNIGLKNSSTFNNYANAVIDINKTINIGLENNATLNNYGTLKIGKNTPVGNYGLKNNATFNNFSGALLEINNATITGLFNSSGTFTNNGNCDIGNLFNVGQYGIHSTNLFDHNSGIIKINRSSSRALFNQNTFNSKSNIQIGSIATVGSYGVYNQGTFNNSSNGNILIDQVSTSGIYALTGTLNNSAIFNIGSVVGVSNLISGGSGFFNNQINGIIKGTGAIKSSVFNNSGGKLSPGYSPGTQNFDAPESFSNSILSIEVNGPGTPGQNFDQITVNGLATLGGSSTLEVTLNYSPTFGDQIPIINSNGLSGTFNTVTGLGSGWFVNYKSTGVVLSYGFALPIELTYFNGFIENNKIILEWRTSTEINNSGFYIEKSENGTYWINLGFVPSEKNNSFDVAYSYVDHQPYNGKNYYRLRQIDLKSEESYSNIVCINKDKELLVSTFYPNPVIDFLYLNFNINSLDFVSFEIYNVNGVKLVSDKISKEEPKIKLSSFDNGNYFLKLSNENGLTQVHYFIISR